MTHSHSRVRNLGLAGGLALVAAILTMLYVSHGKGDGAQAASSPQTSVLVAAQNLPVGTSVASALSGHAIVLKKVASTAIEPGTLTGQGGIAGEVVVQPIYQGEQILRERLGPSSATGIRSVVSGSMRVMEIPGDANQLLAGTLQSGDHVDVVASMKQGEQQTPSTKILLRDVLVLEAPATSSSSTDGSSNLSATVAVTDAQAQSLFNAIENGDWTFVLQPASRNAGSR